MGAMTILRLILVEPNISCIIIDSAFINLRKLAIEVANEKTTTLIPNFVFDFMIDKIRDKILEEAKFDINNVTV